MPTLLRGSVGIADRAVRGSDTVAVEARECHDGTWPPACIEALPMAVPSAPRGRDDAPPPIAVAPAAAPPPRRRRAPFVFGGLLLVAGGIGVYLYVSRMGKETTDDAQVEAHVASVSARVAGQVKRVLVEDNQEVAANAVLLELDDRDQ
jgi:membrane fusion protein (multidrug efflux system)